MYIWLLLLDKVTRVIACLSFSRSTSSSEKCSGSMLPNTVATSQVAIEHVNCASSELRCALHVKYLSEFGDIEQKKKK